MNYSRQTVCPAANAFVAPLLNSAAPKLLLISAMLRTGDAASEQPGLNNLHFFSVEKEVVMNRFVQFGLATPSAEMHRQLSRKGISEKRKQSFWRKIKN
jgi:hypothetical protein